MAKQNLDLFGVIMLSTWWMQAQCFHYFSSVFGLHQLPSENSDSYLPARRSVWKQPCWPHSDTNYIILKILINVSLFLRLHERVSKKILLLATPPTPGKYLTL